MATISERVNQLVYDFNPYSYNDMYDDIDHGLNEVEELLRYNDGKEIVLNKLKEIIYETEDDKEMIKEAKALIRIIENEEWEDDENE